MSLSQIVGSLALPKCRVARVQTLLNFCVTDTLGRNHGLESGTRAPLLRRPQRRRVRRRRARNNASHAAGLVCNVNRAVGRHLRAPRLQLHQRRHPKQQVVALRRVVGRARPWPARQRALLILGRRDALVRRPPVRHQLWAQNLANGSRRDGHARDAACIPERDAALHGEALQEDDIVAAKGAAKLPVDHLNNGEDIPKVIQARHADGRLRPAARTRVHIKLQRGSVRRAG